MGFLPRRGVGRHQGASVTPLDPTAELGVALLCIGNDNGCEGKRHHILELEGGRRVGLL
jgi:hypothetical protein